MQNYFERRGWRNYPRVEKIPGGPFNALRRGEVKLAFRALDALDNAGQEYPRRQRGKRWAELQGKYLYANVD